MKASANEFPQVLFVEAAAPGTPAAGIVKIYAKTDGLMYTKNDAGTETPLGGGPANRNVVSVLTPAVGVVTIDWSLGDYFTLAPTANVTSIVFTNLPSSPVGTTLTIFFTQDTTPRTVAFPASFDWASGVVPAVSTGSGARDLLVISSANQGTTWFASLGKSYA